MPKGKFALVVLATILTLFGAQPLLAQNYDGDGAYGFDRDLADGNDFASPPRGTPPPPGSGGVVTSIRAATKFCSLLKPSEYVIDCLSERLEVLSRQLEGQAGYEEVQEILETTSQKLNRIARDNRSTTLPPSRISSPGPSPVHSTRRLIPVDPDKMDVAVSQALTVIAEAETMLLRSASDSGSRSIEFQRIAAAIGSNKVLLRSL